MYTTVSSPCEGRSGDVSPGVDGPLVMPEDPYAYVVAAFQALPSPDYVPGPEDLEQAPPSPVYIPYVPEPKYPEYIPSEDEVFPAEEQPLPAAALPTTDSQDTFLNRPEVTFPPRKRLTIVHFPGYEAGESLVAAAAAARPIEGRKADYGFFDFVGAKIRRRIADDIKYGIKDTWIDPRDKMAPKRAALKRTTRLNPGVTSNPNQAPSTTTTTVTNAQLQAMIDQGVNAALAARDANRTGDDSHTSGIGVRRTERVTRECTYQDFMKCQPLYFKGTEGVIELT
nr:hypothetical protein [Tanacetum cinerariifolium]